jgi:hypothetical protein
MASKRFSRLSVMLDARDNMSKQFNQAARASEQLQRSVRRLDSELARTGQGNEKVTKSTKDATNSLGYYAKAAMTAARDSAVAYAAGKMLSTTFNTMRVILSGTIYSLKMLGSHMLEAFRNTKLFQQTSRIFRTVYTDIRILGLQVTDAARRMRDLGLSIRSQITNSKIFRTLSTDIKIAAMATSDFSKKMYDTVRNSKGIKAVESSFNGVRMAIIKGTIAFTLWKNSSVFVQKLSNDLNKVKSVAVNAFNAMKSGIAGFITKLRGTQQDVTRTDQSLNRLSSRRATFNELAAANARLNSQLTRMNNELNRGNSSLSKMASQLKNISFLANGLVGIAALRGVAERGSTILKDAVQNSMQQNYDRESMKIVVGKDKGDAYYDTVQNYAAGTIYSPEEWSGALRGIIRKAKNTDEVKKYMLTIEQLATIDPDQGLKGAAYAMRELASGQTKSLVNRFELQKKPLEPLKKITDPMKQAELLTQILGDQTGFTEAGIMSMKELPLMEFKKAQNKIKRGIGQSATGIVEAMFPSLQRFNKAFDDGKFNGMIQNTSKKLGELANKFMSFSMNVMDLFASGKIQSKAQPFMNVFNRIKDTLSEAWPNIKATIGSVGGILTKVANDIDSVWPGVNNTLQTGFTIVKDIAAYINEHYEEAKTLTLALGGAFLTFSILTTLVPAIKALNTAFLIYRSTASIVAVAQWALNAAMFANPIGLIILGISALVAAGILLVRHWDVVKKKAIDVWDGWKTALVSVYNWSVPYINKLIGLMNKLPGFGGNIPKLSLMEMPDTADTRERAAEDGRVDSRINRAIGHRNGLGYVPYNGYIARLHQGERVMTAQENKSSKMGDLLVTGNTFHVRKESDIDEIADKLFNKLYEAKSAMG